MFFVFLSCMLLIFYLVHALNFSLVHLCAVCSFPFFSRHDDLSLEHSKKMLLKKGMVISFMLLIFLSFML